MIAQILRAVFIAVAIYFLTKIGKKLIDQKMDKSSSGSNDNTGDDTRAQLTPCPKCGVYLADLEGHICKGKK